MHHEYSLRRKRDWDWPRPDKSGILIIPGLCHCPSIKIILERIIQPHIRNETDMLIPCEL